MARARKPPADSPIDRLAKSTGENAAALMTALSTLQLAGATEDEVWSFLEREFVPGEPLIPSINDEIERRRNPSSS